MPTCQTSTTYQMHNCNQLHTNAKLLVYIINQMQWKQAKQSLAARCHKAQVQENMRPAHLAIAEFKRAPAPSHEILQSKVPMVDHLSTHWNQTQLAGNQAFPIDLTRGRAPAVLSMTATLLSTYIYIYLRHACRSVPERRHVFRACLLQLQMPNPKQISRTWMEHHHVKTYRPKNSAWGGRF